MRARALGCLGCLAVCAALLGPQASGAATRSVARRHVRAPATAGALRAQAALAAKSPKIAGAAAVGAEKSAGPRTLQDIHIEGEIPVPQVLFITARDQRRFVDFQTQRYLRTSREVGEQTVFPSRIMVTGGHPAGELKETRP